MLKRVLEISKPRTIDSFSVFKYDSAAWTWLWIWNDMAGVNYYSHLWLLNFITMLPAVYIFNAFQFNLKFFLWKSKFWNWVNTIRFPSIRDIDTYGYKSNPLLHSRYSFILTNFSSLLEDWIFFHLLQMEWKRWAQHSYHLHLLSIPFFLFLSLLLPYCLSLTNTHTHLLSLPLSLSLSFSLLHSLTNTHTLIVSPSLSLSLLHTHSLALHFSLTHAYTHLLSLSLTYSLSLSLFVSLSLSLSLPLLDWTCLEGVGRSQLCFFLKILIDFQWIDLRIL